MAFAQTLQTIPVIRSTGEGNGLTISLLKALNHASILLITENPTDEFINGELAAIATHLNGTHLLEPTAASNSFNTLLANLRTLGTELEAEYTGWDAATRTSNVIELTNRIFAIALQIDHELAGFNLTDLSQGNTL